MSKKKVKEFINNLQVENTDLQRQLDQAIEHAISLEAEIENLKKDYRIILVEKAGMVDPTEVKRLYDMYEQVLKAKQKAVQDLEQSENNRINDVVKNLRNQRDLANIILNFANVLKNPKIIVESSI